ncbi:unnamed protein product, partial [Timema podura]|nr:unnamed protein product [Timema podura]
VMFLANMNTAKQATTMIQGLEEGPISLTWSVTGATGVATEATGAGEGCCMVGIEAVIFTINPRHLA